MEFENTASNMPKTLRCGRGASMYDWLISKIHDSDLGLEAIIPTNNVKYSGIVVHYHSERCVQPFSNRSFCFAECSSQGALLEGKKCGGGTS